jgi:hypothetical protein
MIDGRNTSKKPPYILITERFIVIEDVLRQFPASGEFHDL